MAESVGTIFEIREFCLHDGPGIRTTVFFKGCPLRCLWCHNPESWSFKPQLMQSGPHDCVHCGQCQKACPSPGNCIACGKCTAVCPAMRRRLCGRRVTAAEVAQRVRMDAELFASSGGGVTFSGGEPLAQPEFLHELCLRLKPIHLAIETSGFADTEVYSQMLEDIDFVFQDIKCALPEEHKKLTGVDNAPILRNLQLLQSSGKPYIIRIPLVPGLNDSTENLSATARLLANNTATLQEVQLLPYHDGGTAKHRALGQQPPQYTIAAQTNPDAEAIFREARIPVRTLG